MIRYSSAEKYSKFQQDIFSTSLLMLGTGRNLYSKECALLKFAWLFLSSLPSCKGASSIQNNRLVWCLVKSSSKAQPHGLLAEGVDSNRLSISYPQISGRVTMPMLWFEILLAFYYKTRSIKCFGSDFFDQPVNLIESFQKISDQDV